MLQGVQAAGDIASLGKKFHGTTDLMLCDMVQLLEQIREAKLEEFLNPNFEATLKALGMY